MSVACRPREKLPEKKGYNIPVHVNYTRSFPGSVLQVTKARGLYGPPTWVVNLNTSSPVFPYTVTIVLSAADRTALSLSVIWAAMRGTVFLG